MILGFNSIHCFHFCCLILYKGIKDHQAPQRDGYQHYFRINNDIANEVLDIMFCVYRSEISADQGSRRPLVFSFLYPHKVFHPGADNGRR